MADTTYYECDYLTGTCYTTRWNSWGRWVLLALIIVSFLLMLAMCMVISARRRRRTGQQPLLGTGWLAPKQRYQTHHAHPGPPGPAGYYPPPMLPGQDPYGQYYTPPPYTPQYTGTTSTDTDGYYAGPAYEMQGRSDSCYPQPPPPVPVDTHPTGSSYHSNNPFLQQPMSPPEAHVTGGAPRKD